jgi:hypothetical protein
MNDYVLNEPEHWFARWNVLVSQSDIERYKRELLNPLLEQLCDWYEFVTTGDPWRESDLHCDRVPGDPPEPNGIHFRLPFGTYSSVMETGGSDLDNYLRTGSEIGLRRATSLFGELQP